MSRLPMKTQRERLRPGGWYTNGADLRQVIRVGTLTVEVEDATTGHLSMHGIGGFRRNWWLAAPPSEASEGERDA
jgi:hypothetical protein